MHIAHFLNLYRVESCHSFHADGSQIVNTVNILGGKFYNHGGLYSRVFRRWCIRGKFAGKPWRLKPLGFHETPEVNTSVVSFTPTGVNVKLVHTAPGVSDSGVFLRIYLVCTISLKHGSTNLHGYRIYTRGYSLY